MFCAILQRGIRKLHSMLPYQSEVSSLLFFFGGPAHALRILFRLCMHFQTSVECVCVWHNQEQILQVIRKQKLVKKTDGTIPSEGAISMAARDYKEQRHKRGRKKDTTQQPRMRIS